MKQIFTIVIAVLLTASVFAQAPEKMSYQAVIRDASGSLVTNQTVGMQISILQSSASGTVVYSEIQTPTTNENGLLSIEFGGGAGFDTINWASESYFIKTETDPTGGSTYTITGTSQLLSVPYALYAKTAGKTSSNMFYPDGLEDIIPITTMISSSGYNVPEGKTLYITNIQGTGIDTQFKVNGATIFYGRVNTNANSTYYPISLNNPIIVGAGEVVSAVSSGVINGFLVKSSVTPITTMISSSGYTVPEGKTLYITNIQGTGIDTQFKVNGATIFYGRVNTNANSTYYPISLNNPIIVGAGEVVSAVSSGTINGYLR